jgi:transposase-like protein
MGREISSSSISRFSATLDAELESWRERSFQKEYRYVVVDARYESYRVKGKIIYFAAL